MGEESQCGCLLCCDDHSKNNFGHITEYCWALWSKLRASKAAIDERDLSGFKLHQSLLGKKKTNWLVSRFEAVCFVLSVLGYGCFFLISALELWGFFYTCMCCFSKEILIIRIVAETTQESKREVSSEVYSSEVHLMRYRIWLFQSPEGKKSMTHIFIHCLKVAYALLFTQPIIPSYL